MYDKINDNREEEIHPSAMIYMHLALVHTRGYNTNIPMADRKLFSYEVEGLVTRTIVRINICHLLGGYFHHNLLTKNYSFYLFCPNGEF